MRYPIVHQLGANDRGPACLAMVAASHGIGHSVVALKDKAGTDGRGTNLRGLVGAARAIGFAARGVRATRDALSGIGLPAIAHWSEGGSHHFVVLYEVGRDRITVGDPAAGIRRLTPAAFHERWTGILVLLRPARTHRSGNTRLAAVLLTILGLASSLVIDTSTHAAPAWRGPASTRPGVPTPAPPRVPPRVDDRPRGLPLGSLSRTSAAADRLAAPKPAPAGRV